ncbi:hypothetical protein CALVIDRAFT_541066 [Calocera viscosa TUFC12733]|uniref:Uncharacterized protein n=1 Tax=Calocera viscosa (strain TUFC12733) TaxID=1330018 RepID=A0A167I3E0_CALVF|nr:hypothetical protein CALVIDRAFT_541066 [Calocera viscosa TUFC12733]
MSLPLMLQGRPWELGADKYPPFWRSSRTKHLPIAPPTSPPARYKLRDPRVTYQPPNQN